MPDFTAENCVVALFFAMSVAQFFTGWRCAAICVFIWVWTMFTPIRPWHIDMPLMGFVILVTEMIYRKLLKSMEEA